MIEYYLSLYGPIVALGLIAASSFRLVRCGHLGPAIMIGAPSILLIILGLTASFVGPVSVEYVHGAEEEMLGAFGAINRWQIALARISPFAMISIGAGLLWLTTRLPRTIR